MVIVSKSRVDQVYDYLLNSIADMTVGNNKLPSEDDLAVQLGVSRQTIREALKQLLRNGFVKTVHGKGTFGLPSVIRMKNRTNLGANFLAIIRQNYERGDLSIRWQGFQQPVPSISPLLPVQEPVHTTEWLYYADGDMVIYGLSQVLQSTFACDPVEDKAVEDIAHFAVKYLKNPLAYIVYEIKCCINQEVAEKFGIEPDRPVIYWEEKYYDLTDAVCGAGIYYFHPDKMLLATTINIENINSTY